MGKKKNKTLATQIGEVEDQFVYISSNGTCNLFLNAQNLIDSGADCGIRYNTKESRKYVTVGKRSFGTRGSMERSITTNQYKHPEDDMIFKIWEMSPDYATTLYKRGYVIWVDVLWENMSDMESIISSILSDTTKFPTLNTISPELYDELERFAKEYDYYPENWLNTMTNILMMAQQRWLRMYMGGDCGLRRTNPNFIEILEAGYGKVKNILADSADPWVNTEFTAVRIVFPKEVSMYEVYHHLRNTRIHGFIPETGYYLIDVPTQNSNRNFAYVSN